MKKVKSQKGFTIVELMIATTVLSVILLLATVIMTSIGSLYKKGINQSNVQDAARTIMDSVAQDIELSNGSVTGQGPGTPGSVNTLCVNSTRYTYITGVQVGTQYQSSGPVYNHILWRDNSSTCAPVDLTSPTPPSAGGIELIPAHSRLSDFDVPSTAPFNINIRVAYGDDDLLNNPNGTDASCKGTAGDQYCAVSNLTTTVSPRLSQ